MYLATPRTDSSKFDAGRGHDKTMAYMFGGMCFQKFRLLSNTTRYLADTDGFVS